MATETAQIVDFTLPSLGSDMEEGTVLTWLVGPGDHVSKGDVLLRVDTEKAEIDVEVWHEAVVVDLLVQPGDTVPVGTPLARLESGASTATHRSATTSSHDEHRPVEPPVIVGTNAELPEPTANGSVLTGERAMTDAVDRDPNETANGRDAELGSIEGTEATPRLVYWPGPTQAAAGVMPASSTAAVSPPKTDSPSRAERRQSAVASLMERSNTEIPHFHLVRQVDLTAALAWLEERNEASAPPDRMIPAALLLYAVAQATANSPINGTFVGTAIQAEQVDLGVAVHMRGGGLMTPVLPAADALALDTLMWELQAMVGRARAGRLSTRDMTQATVTVTNLGDSGADVVLGVIRPPERALVGFGRIAERPAVVDGALAVRSTVRVTLSADHRVVNGQAGARFLEELDTILSSPENITIAGAST